MECNESLGKLWKDDASSFAHTWGQIPILGQLVKLYDLRGSGQSCALESTALGRAAGGCGRQEVIEGCSPHLSLPEGTRAAFLLFRMHFDCLKGDYFQTL